jgi:hypothetical protein
MQHYRRLVEPLQVRVDAAAPGVAVGFLLDEAGLLGEGESVVLLVFGAGYGGVEGEVGASVKGRVDVDQVDLAGELGQQRGQDILLVAPDEAVAPGLLLGRELEQAPLAFLR